MAEDKETPKETEASTAEKTAPKKAPAKTAASEAKTATKTVAKEKAPAKAKVAEPKKASAKASKTVKVSAVITKVPRLKTRYLEQIAPELKKEFKYPNVMQIPVLTKIVVNMGIGEASKDSKVLQGAVSDLSLITGQKPRENKAKKSIAQFKLREGQTIGASVTLRGARMWEFLDRVLSTALPRIRDFRGLPTKFDSNGNYTFGLTEQSVFHEINQDTIDHQRGMDITVVTTAKTDDEGRKLLTLLGFPFKK
jgi:large subunit ribosomal protein L5